MTRPSASASHIASEVNKHARKSVVPSTATTSLQANLYQPARKPKGPDGSIGFTLPRTLTDAKKQETEKPSQSSIFTFDTLLQHMQATHNPLEPRALSGINTHPPSASFADQNLPFHDPAILSYSVSKTNAQTYQQHQYQHQYQPQYQHQNTYQPQYQYQNQQQAQLASSILAAPHFPASETFAPALSHYQYDAQSYINSTPGFAQQNIWASTSQQIPMPNYPNYVPQQTQPNRSIDIQAMFSGSVYPGMQNW
eukprot:TRINITY_DN315_c0_g1_i1.p1 TRINITY_DN315_c0_g1~~TRINITY_DN315_c0_g1_i1.p1  ORF type:complete len:253 (-),score=61.78 TRINITY_DN315_c0_g1_i1:231-989(-)